MAAQRKMKTGLVNQQEHSRLKPILRQSTCRSPALWAILRMIGQGLAFYRRNPVFGYFRINLHGLPPQQGMKIRIYSQLGRPMSHNVWTETKTPK
jgi:hypothetical protein